VELNTEAEHIDNVGTIFSSFDKTGKYHFVRDVVMANFGEMFSVPFKMNLVDMFVKNLNSKHFKELQQKLKLHPRHIKGRVLKMELV
jgi:hypothetical protein